MDNNTIYKSFDLIEMGLLPQTWADEILAITQTDAIHTSLDGKASTSREPENIEPIDVFVVTGDTVQRKIPWLDSLYRNDLPALASQVLDREVHPSNDVVSGLNINILRGQGARYEWHVDSNPVTGLLFATTHTPGEGGELVFKTQKGNEVKVNPKAGTFLAFDARKVPHTVFPLTNEKNRISIPMNFFVDISEQERPEDLDQYLYKEQ